MFAVVRQPSGMHAAQPSYHALPLRAAVGAAGDIGVSLVCSLFHQLLVAFATVLSLRSCLEPTEDRRRQCGGCRGRIRRPHLPEHVALRLYTNGFWAILARRSGTPEVTP